MKDRLPVYIENLELPNNQYKREVKNVSYGYVNILYILSLIITIGSVVTVIFLGK